MAAPVSGEVNLPQGKRRKPKPMRDGFIQFGLKKNSSPSKFTIGKRRRLKPKRFGFSQTAVKKNNSPSGLEPVAYDPSNMGSQEEISAVKAFKSPAQSSPTLLRAIEFQSSLGTEHPSCIKLVTNSRLSALGLPLWFCKMHMPKTGNTVVIEDENGGQYNIKYITYKSVFSEVEILQKCVLSAGWINFAAEHNLRKGDVLIFHLVEPCKFKVYIIRANDVNDIDGALSPLNSEAHKEQTTPDNTTEKPIPSSKTKRKRGRPMKYKNSTPSSEPVGVVDTHPIEHSGNNSGEIGSEVVEGSRLSKSDLSFREVKGFQDFSIVVNGQPIDSELPDQVRKSYYKLCLSKNDFLHIGIPKTTYYKLVAGMIGETVNIANKMKTCKANTSKEELEAWGNSLTSFRLLGMKVDFLCDRIERLVKLAVESEGGLYVKRYVEAKNELKRMENEIKKVEEKLTELKEVSREFEIIADTLKQKAEEYESKFTQEVDAQW